MLAVPVLASKLYEVNIAVATQSTVGGGDYRIMGEKEV